MQTRLARGLSITRDADKESKPCKAHIYYADGYGVMFFGLDQWLRGLVFATGQLKMLFDEFLDAWSKGHQARFIELCVPYCDHAEF